MASAELLAEEIEQPVFPCDNYFVQEDRALQLLPLP
jgi:hypothetical protein